MLKKTIILSLLISFFFYTFFKREYNWDLFPYIYLTELSYQLHDSPQIHEKSVALIKNKLSSDIQNDLLDSSGFRKIMRDHPNKFFAQMPFYQPRIAYTSFNKFWTIFGINTIDAIYLTSFLFSVLFLILLYKWCSEYFGRGLGLFFCILVLIQPEFIQLSTLATPDMMATFLVLFSINQYEKNNLILYICLGIITIFVRPDKIALLLLLPFIFSLFTRNKILINSLAILTLLGTYIFLKQTFYHHSLEYLFYNTFYDRIYDLNQTVHISFSQYNYIFLKNIWPIIFLTIPMAFYSYYQGYKSNKLFHLNDNSQRIILSSLLTVIALYIIYPSFEPRLNFIYLVIIGIFLAKETIPNNKIKPENIEA